MYTGSSADELDAAYGLSWPGDTSLKGKSCHSVDPPWRSHRAIAPASA